MSVTPKTDSAANSAPRVAVIIPTLNEATTIRAVVISLEENRLENSSLEVIIVDGGSKDGTEDIIANLARNYGNIRFLKAPGTNISESRNLGMSLSRADILINFSGHVSVPKNFISTLVAALQSSGRHIAAVGCGERLMKEDASRVSCSAYWITRSLVGGRLVRPYNSLDSKSSVYALPFYAIRREVLDRVGLFDTSNPHGDDADLAFRIRKHGYEFLYTPETFVYYRPRSTLKRFLIQMFQYGRARMRIIAKYRSIGRLVYLSPLALVLYAVALPFAFALGLPVVQLSSASLAIYLLAVMSSSVKLAAANGRPSFLILMPLMYALEHFGYGFGMVVESVDLFRNRLGRVLLRNVGRADLA
jgi:succinoglycan biosynthesis protein ExoA